MVDRHTVLVTARVQLGVAVLESAGKCTQNAHYGVTVHSCWEMHTKRPQLVHKLGSAQKLPQPWCSFSRTSTAQCSWEMHTVRPHLGCSRIRAQFNGVAVHKAAGECTQNCHSCHKVQSSMGVAVHSVAGKCTQFCHNPGAALHSQFMKGSVLWGGCGSAAAYRHCHLGAH